CILGELVVLNKLLAFIGYIAIWFIGITSRVKIINNGITEKFKKEGQNYIYAFWHGRQLFLVYSHRFRQINILISQSRDGQLITDITSWFGFKAVRGSSTRGRPVFSAHLMSSSFRRVCLPMPLSWSSR
ncbi:MAG: DUF374 domain-containing protein, partial [Proteobacteria bacterium]|nr:DUF374 domain-containing protein [Pseudomonadota bacterium]